MCKKKLLQCVPLAKRIFTHAIARYNWDRVHVHNHTLHNKTTFQQQSSSSEKVAAQNE